MAKNPFPHLPWWSEAVRISEETLDAIPIESWPQWYREWYERKTGNGND